MEQNNFILAISGASGSLYSVALLRALAARVPGTSALIVSDAALRVFRNEIDPDARSAETLLARILAPIPEAKRLHTFELFDPDDFGAKPASGSAPYTGMVVVPCSMKTLAAIANGHASSLIERAADVTLKERRRLVVVPREAPYNLIHLKNMVALTEAGGIVVPASPGFYHRPETIEALGDFIAGKILSLFGIGHNLTPAWEGDHELA